MVVTKEVRIALGLNRPNLTDDDVIAYAIAAAIVYKVALKAKVSVSDVANDYLGDITAYVVDGSINADPDDDDNDVSYVVTNAAKFKADAIDYVKYIIDNAK